MTSSLSIVGLLQYGQMKNEDLFKELKTPDGIDKETLKDNIIMECGKMELLYPDFEFMQFMIGVWSRKNQWTMEKWASILKAEYNPLHNYDRYEEWTDDGSRDASGTGSGTVDQDQTGKNDTLNQVNAYNSDTFRDETHSVVDSEGSSDTHSTSKYKDTSTDKKEHSGHVWGNIGVTTSMELLESQAELGRFNVYDQITALFKSEFCLLIY